MHPCHAIVSLHRRSVSSSIRAARLGNFHGKVAVVNFNGIAKIHRAVLVYTDKECIPGWCDFSINNVEDAAIGLRRASKNEEMRTKKNCVFYCYRATKKTLHCTIYFF